MDTDHLQRSARLFFGSELSSLYERKANKGSAKPLTSLACPKCSAPWIPGINVKARIHNSSRPICLKNKNKRARIRARKRHLASKEYFHVKLIKKLGNQFVESDGSNLQVLLYKCTQQCSGQLRLPLINAEMRSKQNLAEKKITKNLLSNSQNSKKLRHPQVSQKSQEQTVSKKSNSYNIPATTAKTARLHLDDFLL